MTNGSTETTPVPGLSDADLPDWWAQWLVAKTTAHGKHSLRLLRERVESRSAIIEALRQTIRSHFLDPAIVRARLSTLGAPRTAALLREHLPNTKTARSGDLGEILATEGAEREMEYYVPVRRLRWKDGRNMALRGDDIVGLARGSKNKLQFLKGESKSRAALTTAAINEAAEALDRNRGRPSRHSVLFVAERLREQGEDDLASELEEAVLQSFRGYTVEHLLFALTGSSPKNLLSQHLNECEKKARQRYAVGVRIVDHEQFIDELFGGL